MNDIAAVGLTSLLPLTGLFFLSTDGHSAPVSHSRAAPDLEMVSLAASHTQLAPDTNVLVTFVVRATGGAAGPFSVGAYYDNGPAAQHGVPKTAKLLDVYPVEHGLQKGETTAFQMPLRIPPCDVCGVHTVYVVADVAGVVQEATRNNNARAVSLDVAPEHLPNLRVSALSLDKDRGSTSESVGIRGTVQNDSR